MVRKSRSGLILMMFIMLLIMITWDNDGHGGQLGGSGQPFYVAAQPGDCINTFTVRLMVAASNTGSAWGGFEDSRFMAIRKGINPKRCWLELGQWEQDGRLIESKRLQCLFKNPLE